MGFKTTEWAFTVDVSAPMKAVLVALAHRADDKTGMCFPGQSTLADMTGQSRSTVNRALGALETLGVISRERRNTRNGYRTSDSFTLNTAYVSESQLGTEPTRQSAYKADSASLDVTLHTPMSHSDTAIDQSVDQSVDQSDETPQPSSKSKSRGTRIPNDFALTPGMRDWARGRTPDINLELTTEKFINYWISKAGVNATKTDWERTWRNWCLSDQERVPPSERAKPAVAPVRRFQSVYCEEHRQPNPCTSCADERAKGNAAGHAVSALFRKEYADEEARRATTRLTPPESENS